MAATETYFLQWKGIEIKILHHPDFSKAHREIIGRKIDHIEVKASEPLPFTSTGYRSMYSNPDEVAENGGILCMIQNLLEEKAQSSEWKKHEQAKNQLRLF